MLYGDLNGKEIQKRGNIHIDDSQHCKATVCAYVCMLSLSGAQLFATPWTISPPGSTVHGTSQTRILRVGLSLPAPGDLLEEHVS